MDANTLQQALSGLPITEVRYFDSTSSTNDIAAQWAAQGAAEYSLVVASEQTAGRGREGHSWQSPPGSSLSFSVVIRPRVTGPHVLPRLTALGALAVHDALLNQYELPSQIKWPNDILISGRKVAGILAEALWDGDRLDAVILGIGINVSPEAYARTLSRTGPLHLPATSVSENVGVPVDPVELLQAVLTDLVAWRPRVASQDFIAAWESSLAFRGETVMITESDTGEHSAKEGRIVGLAQDGSLRLRLSNGETINVRFGEVRIRPVSTP